MLADRVAKAAEAALAAQGYVSPVDILLGIGWIDFGTVQRWRRGQIECLEQAIRTSPARMAEARRLLRAWAAGRGLKPNLTDYVARTPQRQALRFAGTGDPTIEEDYRTHWISGVLSEKQREQLAAKASRAPDLVVMLPLRDDWKCHRCGGTGDFLIMENAGPACLRCAGLDDLEYLPAGDALLTRRAKARSKRSAVVVRFSRSRGRYERRGTLVEAQALANVRRELAMERGP
jgi:hypothetical protein